MKEVHLVGQEGADALFERLCARDKLHNAQAAADWHHIISAHLQIQTQHGELLLARC